MNFTLSVHLNVNTKFISDTVSLYLDFILKLKTLFQTHLRVFPYLNQVKQTPLPMVFFLQLIIHSQLQPQNLK